MSGRMGDQPDSAMPEIPRRGTPYDGEPCKGCGHLGEDHIEDYDFTVVPGPAVMLYECDFVDCPCEQYVPPDFNK